MIPYRIWHLECNSVADIIGPEFGIRHWHKLCDYYSNERTGEEEKDNGTAEEWSGERVEESEAERNRCVEIETWKIIGRATRSRNETQSNYNWISKCRAIA